MPALPSPRDLRRHLLLIHSVEMHLISIMVLIKMYFILIEILKNALFLQPLYFESRISKNVEKTQSVELYSYTAIQRYTVYSYTSLYTIRPLRHPAERKREHSQRAIREDFASTAHERAALVRAALGW